VHPRRFLDVVFLYPQVEPERRRGDDEVGALARKGKAQPRECGGDSFGRAPFVPP